MSCNKKVTQLHVVTYKHITEGNKIKTISIFFSLHIYSFCSIHWNFLCLKQCFWNHTSVDVYWNYSIFRCECVFFLFFPSKLISYVLRIFNNIPIFLLVFTSNSLVFYKQNVIHRKPKATENFAINFSGNFSDRIKWATFVLHSFFSITLLGIGVAWNV